MPIVYAIDFIIHNGNMLKLFINKFDDLSTITVEISTALLRELL